MTATDPDALSVLLTRAERGVLSTTEATALRRHVEQMHARIAELEQQAAIDTKVMAKADAECDEHIAAGRAFRKLAQQTQTWGEQHRDRAHRYRDRYTTAKVRIRELEQALADADTTQLHTDRTCEAVQRAGRAEAAVDRVRVTVDDLCDEPHPTHDHICPDDVRRTLLAALDEPTQQPTDTTHRYLSTGCLHDQHDYCQSTRGQAGPKQPAACKFCAAPCICTCHRTA